MQEFKNWKPPILPKEIEQADVPGSKVVITEYHIDRANKIFPVLLEEIEKVKNENGNGKVVVSVSGCSGAGKSGIAAVLSYYLNDIGIGSYILGGDNYPRRIPEYNDAERLHLFREGGLKELVESGEYTKDRFDIIHKLQEEGEDAVEMKPGDCINIPAEVKHWHGAAPDEWFSHLAIEVPGEETSNEWCEPVAYEIYKLLR